MIPRRPDLDDPHHLSQSFAFFSQSLFGDVLGLTATPRRLRSYHVSVVAIIMMRGRRNYWLDLPSAVLYGHSFPPCTFSNVSPPSSRCRCLCVGFVKFTDLSSFFFVFRPVFVFSRLQNRTQLSSYTLTSNTPPPTFQPPPGLQGCILLLHTILSPRIINHERQYMFIHQHLTVRILDGVIREAVIYVCPI